jgi:hypothetical protein
MSDDTLNVAYNRKQFFTFLQVAREANLTVDIEGPPGIGKTEMCNLLADWGKDCVPNGLDTDALPEDWRPKVVTFYLSQWTGEDLVGYPHMSEDKGLYFIPPLRLRQLQAGDILIIDEKTTPASPSSIKAMLQLTQGDRPAVGDWEGPLGVTRITLGNRAEDGNVDYEANPVQGNRTMRIVYLGPSADEWLDYVVPKGIHPVIGTYIRMEGRDALNAFDPEQDRSPTPRSWWNGSSALLALERIRGGRKMVPLSERMSVVAACVGDAAALKLESIFALADSMVPFSEIVLNPDGAHVPDPQTEPNELFLCVTHIGNRCKPEHWKQVARYIARLPVEMQGVCVAPILKRHPQLTTTPEFMAYTTRTAGLVIN